MSQTPRRATRAMSSLLTVLVMLTLFVLFTSAVANMAIQRISSTNRSVLQQKANYGCQAGFQSATEWLEKQIYYDQANNGMGLNQMVSVSDFNNANTQVPLEKDPDVVVTTRVTSNLMPTPGPAPSYTLAPVPGPDGVMLQPGQVYVQTVASVGSYLNLASSRHLAAFATLGTENFPYAIQTNGNLIISGGSTVYSYASATNTTGGWVRPVSKGPLGPQSLFWEFHHVKWKTVLGVKVSWTPAVNSPPSPYPGTARVVSNSRDAAAVNISGSGSYVDGPVFCGAGGNPSLAVTTSGGGAHYYAGTSPAPAPNPLFLTKYKPPVEPTSSLLQPASSSSGTTDFYPGHFYQSYSVTGGIVNFHASTTGTNEFYFADTLSFSNCNVTVQPATPHDTSCRIKIYVGKQLNITGSTINDGGSNLFGGLNPTPLNMWSFALEFLAVGQGGPQGRCNVLIDNSHVYGFIAGSVANVTMQNGSIFGGAVKADTLTLKNTQFYYDGAANLPADSGVYSGYPATIPGGVDTTLWGRVSWTMQGVTDYGDSLYNQLVAGSGSPGGIGGFGPGAIGVSAASAAGAGAVSLGAVSGPVTGGVTSSTVGAVTTGAANAASSSSVSIWSAITGFLVAGAVASVVLGP